MINLNRTCLIASGYLYKFDDYPGFDPSNWAGVLTKGLSLEERKGNPSHRLAETDCGVINSIGLANPGAKKFSLGVLPGLKTLNIPVIANLSGWSIEGYGELTRKLIEFSKDSYWGYEINLSCPNIHGGSLEFGTDVNVIKSVVSSVKKETSKPVIAKLTPLVPDMRPYAEASLDAGADAITIANTYPAMAIDVEKKKPILGFEYGGLSGPAIKPITLRHCHMVYREFECDIFASGGIMDLNSALSYIMSGAKWLQIGALFFSNPHEAVSFPLELEKEIKKRGGIKNVFGAAV